MPYDKAEALIKQFGHAMPEQVPPTARCAARRFGEEGQQIVNRRLLAEILKARAEEVDRPDLHARSSAAATMGCCRPASC